MAEMTLEVQSTEALAGQKAKAGLYLTFELATETYGLEILKVQEIIGIMKVTSIPRTPDFVRGVINLRGKVIPVIDLRLKFGMESIENTDRTCIIVVQVSCGGKNITMGVCVDEVAEVMDISAGQVEPPPSFGTSLDTEFIMGMGKVGDNVIMLLDVDQVLSKQELNIVEETSQA